MGEKLHITTPDFFKVVISSLFIFILLLIIFILLLSTASATTSGEIKEVTIEKVSFWERIYREWTPFYISGGDFIPEEINYGSTVDARIEFRAQLSSEGTSSRGNTHKVQLEVWNGKDSISMGERGFKQPIKQGEWFYVDVGGFNTNAIPKSWCNQFIYIRGKHWVWVRNDWNEDTKEVGKFYPTNGGAKLVCPEVNPCPQKDLGKVCYSGDVALKIQDGLVKSDGSCNIVYDILDRCANRGEACENGQCKVTQTIPEGTIMCVGTQGQYKIYNQGSWKLSGCENGELCSDGKCEGDVETIRTCDEEATAECPDGSVVVSIACIEGVEEPTGNECPSSKGEEGIQENIGTEYTPDKKKSTLIDDLFDIKVYGYYTYALIILIIVLISVLLYKKKR